jgi:hypothetical protein
MYFNYLTNNYSPRTYLSIPVSSDPVAIKPDFECQKDVTFIVVSKEILAISMQHNIYTAISVELIKKEVVPVFNNVISNLLRENKHLLLQRNYKYGNLKKKEFEVKQKEYLIEPKNIPIKLLKRQCSLLHYFSNMVMDAEELSVVFNCSIENAEKSIQMLLHEDRTDA